MWLSRKALGVPLRRKTAGVWLSRKALGVPLRRKTCVRRGADTSRLVHHREWWPLLQHAALGPPWHWAIAAVVAG